MSNAICTRLHRNVFELHHIHIHSQSILRYVYAFEWSCQYIFCWFSWASFLIRLYIHFTHINQACFPNGTSEHQQIGQSLNKKIRKIARCVLFCILNPAYSCVRSCVCVYVLLLLLLLAIEVLLFQIYSPLRNRYIEWTEQKQMEYFLFPFDLSCQYNLKSGK